MDPVISFLTEELNPRLPYLREKTAQLTTSPGVYLMKDGKGGIIYIGKAKNLHNRVSSYFRQGADHLPKVEKMVSHVWDYDFIVTGSEYEALLLECSLIKQHKPHYNILLKDDKGYHYIKVSDEPYPRITAEMQKKDDGALYIGPYTGGFVTRSTVEEVNTVFRLPTCRKKFPQMFRKGRPCLNYHIRRCMGVCQGKISQAQYRELIDQAIAAAAAVPPWNGCSGRWMPLPNVWIMKRLLSCETGSVRSSGQGSLRRSLTTVSGMRMCLPLRTMGMICVSPC